MTKKPLYIIALGASAGGYQALWEFFSCISVRTNMAFVVIQHLKQDMTSIADQLLSKYTSMRVTWAADGQCVESNQIYLLPPGKYMTIQAGKLYLSPRDPDKRLNEAIDIFFNSLAHDQDGHGIGIILSGAGTDGTAGAIHLHEQGGP